MEKRISVGDSTRGYDSASVILTKSGKYRVINGTIDGRSSWVKKAVANANKGVYEFETSAGDCLPVTIK